ncbi:hypothetical protein AKJ16_DCAP03454 [Drosera capensis]
METWCVRFAVEDLSVLRLYGKKGKTKDESGEILFLDAMLGFLSGMGMRKVNRETGLLEQRIY